MIVTTQRNALAAGQRNATRFELVENGFESRSARDDNRSLGETVGIGADSALSAQLFDVSPDCLKILDVDGNIGSINRAARRLLELDDASAAALIGRQWLSVWPEHARVKASKALELARDGHVGRFSDRSLTFKGALKWWDVVVSPIPSATSKVSAILVVSRDVTLQKQVEQRLTNSEQRFRALADNIAQFAWMSDADGNIFWYNQRWFQYTGTTIDEVGGWGWEKVQHPDHLERVVTRFKRSLATGELWEDTFPIRGADGSYRWFLSRAMPIRNERDRIVLWCGTNTDVTEQRSISDRLKQKARIIELSHEAILVWELHTGAIVTWNRGCRELYGYATDEALGRNGHELIRRGTLANNSPTANGLSAEGSWSGEQLHFAKDGSEVWVESRQEIIEISGRPVVLETNRDITSRRQFDQMTQLLMAELDHRVKNTLAIVQSIASQTALRSTSLSDFTGSFSARLQSLASAHGLLTESHWAGADLYALLQSQLVETIGDERAIVTRGPNVFLPPQITVQLGLILFELASNGRKHGALSVPGGRIEVTWTVSGTAEGPRLHLVWREIGGPPVTPPSRRGFGTTLIERAGNQTYLKAALNFAPDGLVARIVADVSAIRVGTAGMFNPRDRSEDRASNLAASSGKASVMIVEDEPLIAIETESALASAGYITLGPYSTVADALAAIDKERPDMAVIDGSLFGESADPVAARLQELSVPYLVLTGFTREHLPSPVEQSGAPVLRKPAANGELMAAVAQLDRKRRDARG